MKKWISILAALLALQLILVVVINLSEDDYSAFQSDEKLLTFDFSAIDQLRIEDSSQTVTLIKKKDQWQLPEHWDFPANDQSLTKLLDTLAKSPRGWPVATTTHAADRFKVSEHDFERKVIFQAGEQILDTLYVGSSPGFRKTHVRRAGEDTVYEISLESWEINAQPDYWLKKDILKINTADIEHIKTNDFVLARSDLTLIPDNLTEQEEPNSDAISNYINQLTDLQIQSVIGIEDNDSYHLDQPDLEINVTLKSGDELHYRFSQPDENKNYFMHRSDLPYFFTVAGFNVKPLIETQREQLVQGQEVLITDVESDFSIEEF